uniref:Uncharacterized protein n=1 Tax=Oryza sativa subsp. japonica TaxID=39947 RepID=Q6YUD1_ORYSJ|nr:hypothetical protein [Oryza sativa Japonica Group]
MEVAEPCATGGSDGAACAGVGPCGATNERWRRVRRRGRAELCAGGGAPRNRGGARGRRSRDGRSPAALVEATMPAGRGGDRCTEFPCRAGREQEAEYPGARVAWRVVVKFDVVVGSILTMLAPRRCSAAAHKDEASAKQSKHDTEAASWGLTLFRHGRSMEQRRRDEAESTRSIVGASRPTTRGRSAARR